MNEDLGQAQEESRGKAYVEDNMRLGLRHV